VAGIVLVAVLGLSTTTACAAGKLRYDRYPDGDEVEVRDLDELIADGSAPSGLAGALSVEQAVYDFSAEKDEYHLGKNDVLDIFVFDHPELSSPRAELGQVVGTTIRKDGNLHLPIVGSLPAEGATLSELEAALQTAIARYVVSPHVHVEILRHESQKFFVLGEVARPGVFPVDGDTTLVEALSLAGGIPATADLESATVVRDGEILPINLADVLRRGDVSRNIYMKDRDLVYVPDNVAKKAFVLGEVVQPTAVQIERDSVTLAEALAAARGPTPASARRELAVIRGGFAKPIVYHIELEKALLYDDRIKLRSGDRVIVAPTGLAMASRYMQQLLPFLVGAQALGFTASGASNVAAQAAVQGGN
jgi:polysaccharide export outer membrane protein